jgi:DNA-binding response OmpR family regulator
MSDHVRGSVLVVDDEPTIAEVVARYLERAGYETRVAADGPAALEAAGERRVDLVVLDLMLPGIDGLEVMRRLRRGTGPAPAIILLTARGEESDRITGLRLGADDYVVKPFSPRELVERVKAILRRSKPLPAAPPASALLAHDGLELDPEKHRITRDGRPVTLTGSEYKLLHALMSAPGKAFSREELLNHCYRHGEVVIDRVIDVHIGKLRQKIEDDPSRPRYILTVRGHGYRFADDGA